MKKGIQSQVKNGNINKSDIDLSYISKVKKGSTSIPKFNKAVDGAESGSGAAGLGMSMKAGFKLLRSLIPSIKS